MWRKKRIFFWRSKPGTGAGLLKMWRKKIALFFLLSEPGTGASFLLMWRKKSFFFFLRSEPGTGAGLLKIWRKKSHLFGGMNLEQVLAYWKCGEGIALFFLRSELGTGAGRVDWNCGEREIGIADFSQSMEMRVSLALFFALFHIFFTFFTLFSFFSSFFTFLFSHSFSHFRWPGRGRSLAAFPCLPLTYLTLLLLSSPSLTLIKKKRSIEIFSRFLC